ncbi:MAG TPA: magnesium transporter [Halothiobacillus sp.]|nr:MAG: magnesium transporter [Halothiobacillus sp. 20-54-6]HQT43514.1 magnesium transporter [Halothiobacillus sp.]
MTDLHPPESVVPEKPAELATLIRDIREVMARNRLVEGLVDRSAEPNHALVEKIVHKQNLTRLAQKLEHCHPADIALILEALPFDERMVIWDLVHSAQDGEVLLEVSDAVRASLLAAMDRQEMLNAANTLDTDELADLAPDFPEQVMQAVFTALPLAERERLRFALSYAEDTVGALMDFDLVTVRADVRIEVVLRYLRRMDDLPDHTDKLFVVNRDSGFVGVIYLKNLLLSDPEQEVRDVMAQDVVRFHPEDKARATADAFERYDLISAPVVGERNQLIGRVTINAVMDFIREARDEERLSQVGLREEEDIFAPIVRSVKNRSPWLAVNLVTALIASRVIGLFDGAIEQLVALAALMPIVAGMGGNVGNQTITMIVRELAFRTLDNRDIRLLYSKELRIALINGLIWGGSLGVITFLLYHDPALSLVMATAVSLNFLTAAFFGVTIPVTRMKLGRDPALGSSVLITAITDSGGFFIFLGLATLFLMK